MKSGPKNSRGLEDKDQRILEAAKTLFGRYGMKKTSIEEIAQAAGLGKGTVYLYFKSKDEIFSVLASQFATEFETALDHALKDPRTPTDRLRAFIETRIGFFDRCFREYGATAESILEAESSSVVDGLRKQYGGRHVSIIADLLEEGKRSGEFSFENSRLTSLAIYHVLESLARPWNIEIVQLSGEDKVKACTQLLLDGLLKRN
ncbi:MAG: TetR/AcrR family transcriptional regulator [Chitinophagaceae bacterium]|nr:TetR/AcrR family transcriptional regulator [Oligoflexus sp.]